jgi:hypothetical protein
VGSAVWLLPVSAYYGHVLSILACCQKLVLLGSRLMF